MKPTKCKMKADGCKGSFVKLSIGHKTCSNIFCALEQVRRDKEKKARVHHKAEKIRLKSRREWIKDAQTAFNAYIRQRDEHLPCISCGRHHKGQYHAGHFLSVGSSPELRFEEENCHRQCSACNNYLSGNSVRYRVRLVKKIGLDRVEWLEGPHPPSKWTIEELQGIISTYKSKLKQLT